MVGRLKNGTLEMDAPLSYRDHEESPSANTPLFSPAQDLSIIRKDTYWIESEAAFFFEFLSSVATSGTGAFLLYSSPTAYNQPSSSIR